MKNKIIILVLGIVLLSSLVFALGIGNTDQIVYLMPGDSGSLTFVLMNGEDSNIFVKPELSFDGGVVSVPDSESEGFIMPAKSTRTFSFDVNVPESASLGDTYSIQAIFTTTPGSLDGSPTGGLGMGIRVYSTVVAGNFEQPKINLVPEPIKLKEPYKPASINWIAIVIVLLVVLLIAMLTKRKKNK